MDRMRDELEGVAIKYAALCTFMGSEVYEELDVVKKGLLKIQEAAMRTYMDTLELRIGMDKNISEAFYE